MLFGSNNMDGKFKVIAPASLSAQY
jgi:WD40 repeat protein